MLRVVHFEFICGLILVTATGRVNALDFCETSTEKLVTLLLTRALSMPIVLEINPNSAVTIRLDIVRH